MPHGVTIDIPADDPERAKGFYNGLFGWAMERVPAPNMDYWTIRSPDGEHVGGLLRRGGPGEYPLNFFTVTNIDDQINRVEALGGQVMIPKITIPYAGYRAQCSDTEGNVFGLWQNDHAAR